MPDLLIELFSEDVPARMQARAREDLQRLMTDGLVEAGLTYAHAAAFSTPRRLVLAVEGLSAASRPVTEERKGPRADAPAAAVEGFLRSTGLTRDQLVVRDQGKAQVLFAFIERPGRSAAEIVAETLHKTIIGFPWARSMRWGSGSLRWVRPLRRILCVLSDEAGSEVVPVSVDGIVSDRLTEGHRFMAPGPISVSGYEDYAAKLKQAKVVLDHAEREAAIWHDATQQAFARGLEVVPDAGLLAEVAGLVEWPVVLLGGIDARFLHLPPEVLQTSMREHQKFFSLKNPATGRIEGFATVANRETADHGATILKGNLKVLSARLSDAAFFWDIDLCEAKAGMGAWAEGLRAVTFHAKLGSQAERVKRIAALARELAPAVGADADMAERAARLAKLDLRSAMVGEFPELQGVMGRYYALAAGEPAAVADAARDHWRPKGEGDSVPVDPVSVAVALADKIDTLTGFWWQVKEVPTSSSDPFALRRAALGIVRVIIENKLRPKLAYIIGFSFGIHDDAFSVFNPNQVFHSYDALKLIAKFDPVKLNQKTVEALEAEGIDHRDLRGPTITYANIFSFLFDRLKVFLRDQGIRHDVIDACLAMPGNDDLTLLVKRAEALSATLKTDDGANLLQGFKRANNILTQAEAKDGVEYSFGPDPKFAEGPEEAALFAALDTAEKQIAPAMAQEDFATAMQAMAALRAPIDAFFTAVQVNTDNAILRRNRLNLLHRIRAICGQVADLTKVEG